jgi:hypothetical protein
MVCGHPQPDREPDREPATVPAPAPDRHTAGKMDRATCPPRQNRETE